MKALRIFFCIALGCCGAEPSITIVAGNGTFLWKQVTFTAKGSQKSLKLDFRGSLENQTREKWGFTKFCVKAFDERGHPIRPPMTECIVELTAFNISHGGTIQYKYADKVSLGSGKSQVLMSRFEISLSGGSVGEPNVRRLQGNCDEVWAVTPSSLAKVGFLPESTDRLGGFMRLRYIRGATGWLDSDKDIAAFTLQRTSRFVIYAQFQIVGGTLTFSALDRQCNATLNFEFQAFRGLTSGAWIALPSSGRLEATVLERIASDLGAMQEE